MVRAPEARMRIRRKAPGTAVVPLLVLAPLPATWSTFGSTSVTVLDR